MTNGFSTSLNSNGFININGADITALNDGVIAQSSPSTRIQVDDSDISAGNRGITIQSSRNSRPLIRDNTISNTTNSGILLITSPGSLLRVLDNEVTMSLSSNDQAIGIGVIGNTNSTLNAISGKTVELGQSRSSGILSSSSAGSTITDNAVRIRAVFSTGIEISDGDNVSTNCNQITSTALATPGYFASSNGIYSNGNSRVTHDCNNLVQVDRGMNIVGANQVGSYKGNFFANSRIGLLVGTDDGSTNGMGATIGGQQFRAGNVFNGNPTSLPNPALHNGDQLLYAANAFFADDNPSLQFWPVVVPGSSPGTALGGWFIDDNGPAFSSCGANCFQLPDNWFGNAPCPETEKSALAPSWINLNSARYNAVVKASGEEQDCHEVETCYTVIAEVDQQFQNLIAGNPLSGVKRSILLDSISICQPLGVNLAEFKISSESISFTLEVFS